MQTYQFKAPSLVVNGVGASSEVGAHARGLGRKALIVTDANLHKFGLPEGVQESLSAAGIPFSVYDQVRAEPTVEHVEQGLAAFKESQADFLVAVGGGSPIDTAKAISVLARNPARIGDFLGANKIPQAGAPVIAIPTTAGTGSEVTQFTIITDMATSVKMLIASPYVIPRVALVDPQMTVTMPQEVTAATGIDALTHAIESYVSVKAHPLTQTLALQAIRLIAANLRQAWSDGGNLDARTGMMTGSLMAGLAFSNSSVALVHGMARPVGAYFHVPHGISNASLLPVVVEFSILGNPRRYADIADAMGEAVGGLPVLDAAFLTARALKRLNDDLKIPSLRGLGVDREKFDSVVCQMATDAIASGSPGNNPRKATHAEIVELYRRAY